MTRIRTVPTKKLVHIVMVECNPWHAIQIILDSFSDPTNTDAYAVYRAWANTRQQIYKNMDHYVNPDYENQVRMLQAKCMPWTQDFQVLENLLTSSLGVRVRFHESTKQVYCLEDETLNAILKQIKPLQEPFYEFIMPQTIIQKAQDINKKRVLDNHQHTHNPSSFYNFDQEMVTTTIDTARNYICNPSTKPKTSYLLACLQILTGRRNIEICGTAVWTPVPGKPYQASISGIAKQTGILTNQPNDVVVPLLSDFDTIHNALQCLRATQSTRKRVIPSGYHLAQLKLFGRKLTHTQYRGVYIHSAFQNRSTNEFHPDVSRDLFNILALGHTPSYFSTSQDYSTINVNN